MSQKPLVTPRAALLRVLISGESDGPEIVRKVREWTDGHIRLDDDSFISEISELEKLAFVERRSGSVDKRTGQPRITFVLTATGKTSALQVLAASLTRKG
jgi:DNA-binding PadR family transcriptional regulator